jgi:hypothetical protein
VKLSCLLSPDFSILFDVDVLGRLEGLDMVIWVVHGEALDEAVLVLDGTAVGSGLLLGLFEFLGRGVLFKGNVVERHFAGLVRL